MRERICTWLVIALAALVLTGCASMRKAREMHLLSDARQIVSARYVMIAEHPENKAPTLDEVVAYHELLDSERAAPFETTDDWDNAGAGDAIVLRQKETHGGRRIVALGNGAALVIKEKR